MNQSLMLGHLGGDTMESDPNSEITPRQAPLVHSNTSWIIYLFILSLLLLVFGVFVSKDATTNIAYLIGYSFGASITYWAIFYFSAIRRRGRKIAGIAFTVICASVFLGHLLGGVRDYYQTKPLLNVIQETFISAMQSRLPSEDNPLGLMEEVDTARTLSGEMGEFEVVLKEYMSQLAVLNNNWVLESNNIVEMALDPVRISEDSDGSESREIIKKMKSLPRIYRKRWLLLVEETADKIETLNITDYERTDFLRGFRRGVARADRVQLALQVLRDKEFVEFEAIIDLLEDRKGMWEIQEGQFMFYDDNDVKRYNEHFIALQDLEDRQFELLGRNIEESKQKLNELSSVFQ